MSLESAALFLTRFNEDEDFRSKIESATNEEIRNDILKKEGFSFTQEELKHVCAQPHELSNGDLDAVAGGINNPPPPTFV